MDHDARRRLLRAIPAPLVALAVTPPEGGAPHATLVSWVTQASFDPPLVAVALERGATTLPLVARAGDFTLAPLERGAAGLALARRLGRRGTEVPDKLAGVALRTTPSGLAAVDGGAGWLSCRVVGMHDAGDHTLVVARVTDASASDPLPAVATAAEAGWPYAG